MDKGTDRIAQDVKDIIETRIAIANKLDKIEHRFSSAVEEAKTMAEDFADRTQSAIERTMDTVKEATDPSRLVSRHPWVMVSGAILMGFAVGHIFRQDGTGVIPYYPPGSHAANVMPPSGADTTRREGVYPFYPHHQEGEDYARTPPSTGATVLNSLAPVVAESLGHVTAELVDIGKSALRAWLKEVARSNARDPRPTQNGPREREPLTNPPAASENDHGIPT